MIPAFMHLLKAFLFDETAFLRWSRAIMLACAAGGLAFADQVAAILGAPAAVRWIKIVSIVCAGLSVALGAGDKTSVEKVTDALAKASPENIAHAIAHREDTPPQAPTP